MSNYSTNITPVLPKIGISELNEKNIEAIRLSGLIANNIHEETLKAISELVRKMNSYYSNLIEGNYTTPAEIDNALNNKFSKDPLKRSLELEHVAHINVQKEIEEKLKNDKNFDICTTGFIKEIHKRFYEMIPLEFRIIKLPDGRSTEIIPGEFRKFNVKVGNHIPVDFEHIEECMDFFCNSYKPEKLSSLDKITAAAASHHRLTYIHPFPDGNGRTSRLFTHAYLVKAGVNTKDLWSISRAFARNRNLYYSKLSNADEKRLSDTDGRGNLSERRLTEFCIYFTENIIDQVNFMSSMFEFSKLFERIRNYIDNISGLKKESFLLIKEAVINGKVKRGEVPFITGMNERTARRELVKIIEKGLLYSDTPKGALKIAFPEEILEYYFPRLYPAV